MTTEIIFSLTLLGVAALCGLTALLLRKQTTAVSSPVDEVVDAPDILAEVEDARLTARFVAHAATDKHSETPDPHKPQPAEKEPEPEPEIEWEESDDVFRPRPVDRDAYLKALLLKTNWNLGMGEPALLIRKNAMAKLEAHLKSDMTVEQGGLLVGQVFRDEGKAAWLLQIEEAFPAREGIETATSFAYTSETWRKLSPELAHLPADWTILGSYHSHPGLGVFLSETDLETQADIFCHDWQTALVIDPVKQELGFFLGKSGKPVTHWQTIP